MREWHWAEYLILENDAVSEEVPSHFKVAVGGKAKMTWGTADAFGRGLPASGFVPLPRMVTNNSTDLPSAEK